MGHALGALNRRGLPALHGAPVASGVAAGSKYRKVSVRPGDEARADGCLACPTRHGGAHPAQGRRGDAGNYASSQCRR